MCCFGKLVSCCLCSLALIGVAVVASIVAHALRSHRRSALICGPWCDVCGHGDQETQARTVQDFTGLEVHNAFYADVTTGSQRWVNISDNANIIDKDYATVDASRLFVRRKDKVCGGDPRLTVSVPVALAHIGASGASEVTADTATGNLWSEGGSHLTVHRWMATAAATISASGGARVQIGGGSAAALSVTASGGSPVELSDLQVSGRLSVTASGGSRVIGGSAADVEITASGGSRVQVTATGSAKVTCSGGSHVTVAGGAQIEQQHSSTDCTVVQARRRLRGD